MTTDIVLSTSTSVSQTIADETELSNTTEGGQLATDLSSTYEDPTPTYQTGTEFTHLVGDTTIVKGVQKSLSISKLLIP